jgi:hypothetical protein
MTVRLLEDGHERRRVVSPEARQGAVVRLATSGQVHAGRLLARQPGQLARGTYPVQIAPGQYAEQRMRVVGLLAFRTRRDDEVPQIDRPHQVHEHMHRVLRRQRRLQAHDGMDIRRIRLEVLGWRQHGGSAYPSSPLAQ